MALVDVQHGPPEARPRLLVVEDDDGIAAPLVEGLERDGFAVERVRTGAEALAAADRADLVLLDLGLPDLEGTEVCRRLRSRSGVPIIVVTARGDELDRVMLLELGADDYVVKPFSPRELVLRVTSVLRRATHAPPVMQESIVDGSLVLDPAARRCTLDGVELSLTTREFDLLAHLMRNPRRAFTRAELLESVWGWNFGDQSTVTVHMRRLREKIEPKPDRPNRISTVWGVGYRYDPEAD